MQAKEPVRWKCTLRFPAGPEYEFELSEAWEDAKFRTSLLWYCGACGASYARLHCLSPFSHREEEWIAIRRCCEQCEYITLIPGSIFILWDRALCAAFPLPVLQREFDLHYEYLRKKGELP